MGKSFSSSYFLYCILESIVYKLNEYVGNPRPMVIRCLILYNRTGDSTGESDHVSYMIDNSSCYFYSLYAALGHLCVVLTVQGFFLMSDL